MSLHTLNTILIITESRKPWSMYVIAKEGKEDEYAELFFDTAQHNTVTGQSETLTLELDNALTKLIAAYLDW